ncbi:MAG: hypothetical protein R3C97_11490 [Geminicoccaceae bacterium]
MFRPSDAIIDAFVARLIANYRQLFSHLEPDCAPAIEATARLALDRISGTDAFYHDIHHTIRVVDVGQAILRGMSVARALLPSDWLHFTNATLLHDIGYLRDICPGDDAEGQVIDEEGNKVRLPRGSTDAFLAPWHVDRGQIFVRDRLGPRGYIDAERLCRAIEMTRFPIPEEEPYTDTEGEAALVRAADLIGQLADPDYPRKLTALYTEFRETGLADRLGYRDAADLAERHPQFFWNTVEPYIGPALCHLQRTGEGRVWIAHLYAHVFVEERLRPRLGPQR